MLHADSRFSKRVILLLFLTKKFILFFFLYFCIIQLFFCSKFFMDGATTIKLERWIMTFTTKSLLKVQRGIMTLTTTRLHLKVQDRRIMRLTTKSPKLKAIERYLRHHIICFTIPVMVPWDFLQGSSGKLFWFGRSAYGKS